MKIHQPVLLKETLSYLDVKEGERYIDATYGAGGHTREILNKGGLVLGLDVNPDAVRSAGVHPSLKVVRANFNKLKATAKELGFYTVAGIVFDLGVSSDELLEVPGLSFQRDEPLDMRLDPTLGVKAADLLAALPERNLYELFATLGEEPFSRPLARAIVRARGETPIKTTRQLTEIIERVKRGHHGAINQSTQVFQALRIAVNTELENLTEALPQARELLKENGRLVVISFHSGEDRIVKNFIKTSMKTLTEKPVTASEEEIRSNPRSRSAKLRAAWK